MRKVFTVLNLVSITFILFILLQNNVFATDIPIQYISIQFRSTGITYFEPYRSTNEILQIDTEFEYHKDYGFRSTRGLTYTHFDSVSNENLGSHGGGPTFIGVYNDVPGGPDNNQLVDRIVFFASDTFQDYLVVLTGNSSILSDNSIPSPYEFSKFTTGYAEYTNSGLKWYAANFDPSNVIISPSSIIITEKAPPGDLSAILQYLLEKK